jgi:hypothetical protein
MAKVIGTSQAWNYIAETLASRNLTVDKIESIQQLLKQKRLDYEKAKEEATKSFEAELDQAIKNLVESKVDFQSVLESSQKESNSQIELIETTIQFLQEERWIIRRIINKSKIRGYRKQIGKIKARHNKHVLNLQESIVNKQKILNLENRIEIH